MPMGMKGRFSGCIEFTVVKVSVVRAAKLPLRESSWAGGLRTFVRYVSGRLLSARDDQLKLRALPLITARPKSPAQRPCDQLYKHQPQAALSHVATPDAVHELLHSLRPNSRPIIRHL